LVHNFVGTEKPPSDTDSAKKDSAQKTGIYKLWNIYNKQLSVYVCFVSKY